MASSVSYSTFNIGEFHGVDYASNQLTMSPSRSPDMLNLIPAENGALRSRNGYEEILQCDGRINGIYTLREAKGDHTLIHHGNKISEWKNHTMAKYVVPDEGLPVMYNFTIGEQTFGFTREKLSNDDDVTYSVSSGKLIVNGVEQELNQSTEGTPIHMECTEYEADIAESDFGTATSRVLSFVNPNGGDGKNYLRTKTAVDKSIIASGTKAHYYVTNMELHILNNVYELEGATSYTGILLDMREEKCKCVELTTSITWKKDDSFLPIMKYWIFNDPANNKYTICVNIDLNLEDIPEEGVVFRYYNSSGLVKWKIRGMEKSAPIAQRVLGTKFNLIDYWMSAGQYWTPNSWEILSAVSDGVNYSFEADGENYYFSSLGLAPKDELVFDYETKSLYLNDEKVETSPEELFGQSIVLEEYNYPLVWQNVNVPDAKSSCQQMGNRLYILTGAEAYVYGEWDIKDDDGGKIGSVYELRKMEDEAYVPTVVIAGSPVKTVKENGKITEAINSGQSYESINLLSSRRMESFMVPTGGNNSTPESSTSGTWYYKLPLSAKDINTVIKVEKCDKDGNWVVIPSTEYTTNTSTGIITFNKVLEASPLSGIGAGDNYRVTYVVARQGGVDGEIKSYEISNNTKPKEMFNPPTSTSSTFLVPLYRLYIGNTVSHIDNMNITLKLKPTYYCCDKNGGNSKYMDNATITVSGTSGEVVAKLPNGQEAYLKWGKNDAKWYIHYNIIQEGNKFYLEITPPYANAADRYYSEKKQEWVVTKVSYFCELNKVSISAKAYTDEYADRINKATISTKFGYAGNMDRLFVAGWDKMREYEFWSEVDNPLYFPDLNYAKLGDEDTAVMGWSRINNNQMAIHKEANGSDPTIYIQTAEFANQTEEAKDSPTGTYNVLGTYEVAFPVSEGPAGDGVISQRAFGVLNGEPLALSESGVFATQYVTDVAADVRYAAPRSYYINPKLKELNLKEAEAVTFDNKYFLAVDGYVFVADGKQKYAVGGNQGYEYSYEWFPWDNLPVRVWWVNDGQLHFGTADGKICRFNNGFMDIDEAIRTYWTSPWLDFGTQAYYKKAKNVIVTCLAPKTDFCELGIDYITDKAVKNVKNYLIDNTAHSNAMKSIATNYKLKKISGIKIRVRNDNADDFGIGGLSVLYTVSGKYKG